MSRPLYCELILPIRRRDITTRISGATIARCVSGRAKKNSQRIDTEILCELKRRWLKFDRIRQRFILTPAEKRMAIFILASFLLGLSTKYYRDTSLLHAIAIDSRYGATPKRVTTSAGGRIERHARAKANTKIHANRETQLITSGIGA